MITALSVVRAKDGYTVLTLKVQGDKVVSAESTPEDMRAIALEAFRVRAGKEFFE